jgi:D-alanyl-D-alanine carboxypeptidase (penicillin-binding protein 5/6)
MNVHFRPRDVPPRPRRNRRRRRLAFPGGSARRWLVVGAVLAIAGFGLLRGASSGSAPPPPPPAPTVVRCAMEPVRPGRIPCRAGILVEAETGAVLWSHEADARRGPASLVKMMLMLETLRDVAAGKVALSDSITTSANASTMGGSQVFLKHGEVQTLQALLEAVGIASANDAAMAIAEHLEGSEEAFVKRMNAAAKELGCTQTEFVNVHGLDLRGQGRNDTSARDLARIARELVRYDEALRISSTWRKPFRGGEFWLDNTNKLLREFDGLDGLKTGWTPRAGGCFVGTAKRDGVRLIAVILAAQPGRERFEVTADLLEAGYAAEPTWVEVIRPGDPVADVAPEATEGAAAEPEPVASAWGTVRVLVEADRRGAFSSRYRPRTGEEKADGVPEGVIGWLDLRLGDRTIATVPAWPAES